MGDTTNLVSAYKLDDDTTTTADAFGTNTLSENGTITSVTGVFNNAHQFDAVGDYWSITDAAQSGLDITGDLSITAFIKMQNFTNNNRNIAAKGVTAYTHFLTASAQVRFVAGSTQATASTGTMATNTIYHTASVLDTVGQTVKYYIDGALDSTITSFTATPTNNALAFCIASGNVNYGDVGDASNTTNFIDEVCIFARTISLAEVQDLKNNGIDSFIGGGATAKPARMMTLGVQ